MLRLREPPKGKWWQARAPMLFESTEVLVDEGQLEALIAGDYRLCDEGRALVARRGDRLAVLIAHLLARED